MRWHGTAWRRISGFTLVELMVTVAIFAILTTVAVPSFREYIANQRAKTAATDLMATLAYARSEAVKRNASITVSRVDDSWAKGWEVRDAANNLLRSSPALAQASVVTAAASVSYLRSGRLAAATVTFDVCDLSLSNYVHKRVVRVDTSGQPSIRLSGKCS